MIFKNRTWYVGNDRYPQVYPFKFQVEFNRHLNELVLVRGILFRQIFSMEEIDDMKAILNKLNKEKREDII